MALTDELHTVPQGSDPDWTVPDAAHRGMTPEFWRTFDSTADGWGSNIRPLAGDLLSRKPHDVTPGERVCTCGAPVLRCWASDDEGFGSRWTMFDPQPVEDGCWFQQADGSLRYDPLHGTHRLHNCPGVVA